MIRLYSEDDFARRPEQEAPEILRRELSHTLLFLHSLGIADLHWFEAPPEAALNAAHELLVRLGAIERTQLTEIGQEMARLPLHPRLARLLIEAQRRGVGKSGCAVAAVLSAGERTESRPSHPAPSDLLLMIEREWQPSVRRVFDQVRRSVSGRLSHNRDEASLLLAILSGFPDRVARRRQATEYLLAGGGSATLAGSSAVSAEEFIVAVEIDSRRDRGLPMIRIASAIRPDWLLDLFPERVEAKTALEWNRIAERADAISALHYDGLTIDETRGAIPDPIAAAEMLAGKAISAGFARFTDLDELEALIAQVAFASEHSAISPLSERHLQCVLHDLCDGKRSFPELAKVDIFGAIRSSRSDLAKLDDIAPSRLRLSGGRQVRVHYEPGKPPWIASRLQDFFGMKQTPIIAGVPVVVHLLAPSQRPVQTTTDLAGFWQTLYPRIRRELSRKYPKHAWPERPI